MRRTDAIAAGFVATLAIAVIAIFWCMGYRRSGPPLGFPLDDAWIHIRFGQNLARHAEFAFNPGEPTAGSTSPLWVALLAGVSLIFRDFVASALALSLLSYLILVLATWFVLRRMLPAQAAAVAGAIVVAVNVRIAWSALSGMEICLAAFLAIAATGLFAADEAGLGKGPAVASGAGGTGGGLRARLRGWAVPVLFALASLARPEAHLLFGLAVLLRLMRRCRRDTEVSELVRLIPYRMILVYFALVLPWHLFSHFSSGSLLPNTFWANFRGLATQKYLPGYLKRYAEWLFIKDHPSVYWFAIPGLIATVVWTARAARTGREPAGLTRAGLAFAQLSVLWVVFYPLVSRFVLPMTRHHARYMVPMTPFHAILAALGIWALISGGLALSGVGNRRSAGEGEGPQGEKDGPPRDGLARTDSSKNTGVQPEWLWAAVAAAVFLTALPDLEKWSEIYGRNVYSINNQHVKMATWLRDNLPADSTIATHDIGAIGAISQRRVLDIFGLVSPEMIRWRVRTVVPTLDTDPAWYLVRLDQQDVDYLVGYTKWLPITEATDCFEEEYRAELEQADICGDEKMIAFRVDKERLKELLADPAALQQPPPEEEKE